MLLPAAVGGVMSLEAILTDFIAGIVSVIPGVLSGLLFVLLAYVAIKLILVIVRSILDSLYPDDQDLIVELAVVIAGIFLWFGVLLALLKIVGLGDIAASLGTSAGFVALGMSFALKDMIADTVAGVYLLKVPVQLRRVVRRVAD